jgi:hypothetical protein
MNIFKSILSLVNDGKTVSSCRLDLKCNIPYVKLLVILRNFFLLSNFFSYFAKQKNINFRTRPIVRICVINFDYLVLRMATFALEKGERSENFRPQIHYFYFYKIK